MKYHLLFTVYFSNVIIKLCDLSWSKALYHHLEIRATHREHGDRNNVTLTQDVKNLKSYSKFTDRYKCVLW